MSGGNARRRLIALAAVALAATCAVPLAAGAGEADGPGEVRGDVERGVPDPQISALEKLRRQASGPTDATFVSGFPRLVETSVSVPGGTPVARAVAYLRRYRGLYGQFMSDPFQRSAFDPNELPDADPGERVAEYRRTLDTYAGEPASTPHLDLAARATSRPGMDVVAISQTYKGLPIVGADLLVLLDATQVKATVGGLLSDLDLGVRPGLDLEEAEDAARSTLRLGDADTAPAVGRTHLVVFAPALLQSGPEAAPEPRLAWQVALGGGQPYSTVVDARSGELLQTSSGITSHNGLDDYDLDLEDSNDHAAVSTNCYETTTDDDQLGDEDGLNSAGQADPLAVKLWSLSKKAYVFFHLAFNRHSYDNDGGQFELYLHPSPAIDNAHWVAGDCALIEFHDDFVAYDILIHELTHGIDEHSLLGGLVYQGQSGALDESHADTMGARADQNWTVGEDTVDGAIRDLSNPPAFSSILDDVGTVSHPDRMSELVTTSDDNGGVHVNSGIINKTSFLIAHGGAHPDTGVQVTGIGEAAMGWLTYMALQFTPPNASFVDNRGLMVAFADASYSAQATCQVRNAYFAVEIGNPDTNCDGEEDDPDPDGDGEPIGQDNCPGNPNPSQKDTDGDGKGDVCDGDADEDGVFWPNDNCPNVGNTDQTDANFNGKGEACDPTEDDDFDDDGDLNVDDNCLLDPNEDQADVDSDGDGDACDPDSDGDGWSNDDDNAPFEPNPDQADSDGDGIGDVSDECPGTADENVAWTSGDPNLGTDPMPQQPDSDGDGTPDACDPSVLVTGRFTAATNFLRPDGRTRQVTVDGSAGDYLKVPLFASSTPGFDQPFADTARRLVELTGVDSRINAWIGDDQGRSAAQPNPKSSEPPRLEFRPIGGHRYFLFLHLTERYTRVGPETFQAKMSPTSQPARWPEPPPARG